ncbi:hypothetical protein DRZ77_00245 [Candidatus Woesearchaeota archaeon]|nr:DUF504 domain-containing protein [Candidatus Woesearchaeota archaeon]RLE41159.1 MAG: hypothetical protein DRZ77_00245 [Candidatus Woesearchaeota archaeon]
MRLVDLLNKIRWDEHENEEDYEVWIYDRIAKKEKKIAFKMIANIGKSFIELIDSTEIPLHRIRKIVKRGEVVWEKRR